MQDETPLHVTAVSGSIRCMEELISRGADVKPVSKASLYTILFLPISLIYNKTERYYYCIIVFSRENCSKMVYNLFLFVWNHGNILQHNYKYSMKTTRKNTLVILSNGNNERWKREVMHTKRLVIKLYATYRINVREY